MRKNENVIIVGAIGGSGTRIVAEFLIKQGIYMGNELNHPNDFVVFSRIFKNPELYRGSSPEIVQQRIELFTKIAKQESLSWREFWQYFHLARKNTTFRTGWFYFVKFFKHRCFKKTITSSLWGWKEPNTMLFLEPLSQFFPKMKYVHVIRHGLDMAYSNNMQQLMNWHFLFSVEIPDDKKLLPAAALEYWIRANRSVIETGKKLLGDRFYLLSHDRLCASPEKEINALMKFLAISLTPEELQALARLVRCPEEIHRYHKQDLSIFSKEQLEAVKALGFEI